MTQLNKLLDELVSLQSAYGVYSVQAASPSEHTQGTSIANAAKAPDMQHLVYSSVGGVESQNTFRLLR